MQRACDLSCFRGKILHQGEEEGQGFVFLIKARRLLIDHCGNQRKIAAANGGTKAVALFGTGFFKPCARRFQTAPLIGIASKPQAAGKIERYFVMIRELPVGENPHDKTKWAWANPCLRYPNEYSKYLLDQIETEYTAAYGSNDPHKIRQFLTRRLCQWQTGSVNRYLDEHLMELARKAQVSREEFARLTDGREAYCGFDLGKRIDLSGAGAVFLLDDGRVAIKAHGFMPRNQAQRHEHTDRVPYLSWAEGGYCTLTPGDVTDNSYVENWICSGERDHSWVVLETDYDGHNATDLAIKMCQDRNNEDFCVEISQTCAGQNLAVKGFRELLLQGRIIIEENPLVMWCLANAVEIQNNYGDLKLSKKHKDDTERIDPVAAVMNSLARALVRRENPTLADVIAAGRFSM